MKLIEFALISTLNAFISTANALISTINALISTLNALISTLTALISTLNAYYAFRQYLKVNQQFMVYQQIPVLVCELFNPGVSQHSFPMVDQSQPPYL